MVSMENINNESEFFQREENISVLRKLYSSLNSVAPEVSSAPDVVPYLKIIVNSMVNNPKFFDDLCTVNINWIGVSFVSGAATFPGSTLDNQKRLITSLFTFAYRFLCELDFSRPGELSLELRRVIGFVNDNLLEFSGEDRQQLIYANFTMPAAIAKHLINSPSIIEFGKFASVVESARELKKKWDSDIEEQTKLSDGLKDTLKNINTELNFVGLVHGFLKLAKEKRSEKLWAFIALIFLGVLMLAPAVVQIIFVFLNNKSIDEYKNTLIYILPAVITMEVIFLYFFRVVLSQFRAIKFQLLQLDLRVSLCQFVQSYSDYAVQIKSKSTGVLDKFESLVFSGIAPGDEGFPSTFEGVEQISTLIKSARG